MMNPLDTDLKLQYKVPMTAIFIYVITPYFTHTLEVSGNKINAMKYTEPKNYLRKFQKRSHSPKLFILYTQY